MKASKRPPWMHPALVSLVVILLSALFVGVTLANHGGEPLVFATVGENFRLGAEFEVECDWYDGRYYYVIARDMLGATDELDAAAYRYQRILYPLLAWLLSGGGDGATLPWMLIGVNLLAAGTVAGVLAWLLAREGRSGWYALVVPLSIGGLFVLRGDMSEMLALALDFNRTLPPK